jgi:hypothetical protein
LFVPHPRAWDAPWRLRSLAKALTSLSTQEILVRFRKQIRSEADVNVIIVVGDITTTVVSKTKR